jgi:hypothetical protein
LPYRPHCHNRPCPYHHQQICSDQMEILMLPSFYSEQIHFDDGAAKEFRC